MLKQPELVFYGGSTLLESPCWDVENEVVYCVSIEQCMIYRLNPKTGEIQSFLTDGRVGCAVVEKEGTLLSAEKSGVYRIKPWNGERTFLKQLDDDPAMRYNDGKLDPCGRLLVGTKGDEEDLPGRGRLYSFDGRQSKTIVSNTTISNGIGFSDAGDILYFVDTPTKKVGRYKYDIESGEAVFDSYAVELEGTGYPDGMCVDVDGTIWVAEWDGGRVCRWDPETGVKLDAVRLPCSRVTSCCLGGANLNCLYVTTAKDHKNAEPLAGALFKVKIR